MFVRLTRLYGYLFAALLALVPLVTVAEPFTYSAKEIHGQVVDEATGAPLEGVVIVAQWQLVRMINGWRWAGDDVLKIIEAVTDKEGKYFIPGWGPKLRPLTMHLEDDDPGMSFFKPGYYPEGKSNPLVGYEDRNTDSLRTSQWDGQVIRLKKFTGKPEGKRTGADGKELDPPMYVWDGTLEQYAFFIHSMQGDLHWGSDNFNWEAMPHMVIALKKETERLAQEGLKPGHSIDSISP